MRFDLAVVMDGTKTLAEILDPLFKRPKEGDSGKKYNIPQWTEGAGKGYGWVLVNAMGFDKAESLPEYGFVENGVFHRSPIWRHPENAKAWKQYEREWKAMIERNKGKEGVVLAIVDCHI